MEDPTGADELRFGEDDSKKATVWAGFEHQTTTKHGARRSSSRAGARRVQGKHGALGSFR